MSGGIGVAERGEGGRGGIADCGDDDVALGEDLWWAVWRVSRIWYLNGGGRWNRIC